MRHYLSILSSTLLLAVLLSCQTEISIYPAEPDKGVVLNASFAEYDLTKTELGRATSTHTYAEILWSEGDALSLFFNATNARMVTNQAAGLKAVFHPDPDIAISGDSFLGLYPYNENATANGNVISTVIPAVQTAVANSFDPDAMLAVGSSASVTSSEISMAFRNVCSGICFTLSSEASKYKRIVLQDNASAPNPVAGNVSISMANPNAPAISAGSGASDTVELLPPANGGFKPDTQYYICLVPQQFKSGFKMYFCTDAQQLPTPETCTANVVFTEGRFARIDQIDTKGKLGKIRYGEPLDTDGTANCYIVSKPGSYKFRMVKGNDVNQELEGVTKVAVLWETDNTTTAPAVGSIVKDAVFNRNYVYFDTPSSLKDGNALIAAYSGNDILWSWHIWVCADDPASHPQKIYSKPHYMMDRNLGALKALPSNTADAPLCNGLFYQWGRKDPFPGPAQSYYPDSPGGSLIATTAGAFKAVPDAIKVDTDKSNNTLDYAIKHPDVYLRSSKDWLSSPDASLWAETKTIYDPCPHGWKVPNAYDKQHDPEKEAWSVSEGVYQRVEGQYYGMYFNLEGSSARAWYPNPGYLGCNAVLYMAGQYTCYWSCSTSISNVYTLEMNKDNSTKVLTFSPYKGGKIRGEGNFVRCIEDY